MIATRKRNILLFIFVVQICIYLLFLYIDLTHLGSTSAFSIALKYSGILLCLFTAALIGNDRYSKRDAVLLQLGLFFTALADFSLLILDYYTLGVALFCIVQSIYIFRYNPRLQTKHVIILLSCILLILVLFLTIKLINFYFIQPLFILAPLYAVLLISSVSNALLTFSRKVYPRKACFIVSLGMILFMLCDINVALFNMLSMSPSNTANISSLESASAFMIWLFYFPSQVLLSLSAYKSFYIIKR